jgi:hypothetical protein
MNRSAIEGFGGFIYFSPFPPASPLGNVLRIEKLPPLNFNAPFSCCFFALIQFRRFCFPNRPHGHYTAFLVIMILMIQHTDLP